MLALVIDTSSAAVTTGIVRYRPERVEVLAERVTVNARAHAEFLAPAIADCLQAAGITAKQLQAVVAGVGPGPFTGLRVGLMSAAAFADALSLPTYGVCSLDGIGVDRPGSVLVAGDARRREIYWALYTDGRRHGDPAVASAAAVAETVPAQVADMVGAGARLYAQVLGLALGDADYPTVAGLARCAAGRIAADQAGQRPMASGPLTPLYLRRPDAVEPSGRKVVRQ